MFHDFCQSVTLVFCQRTHVSHDHHPRGPCCSRARISYDEPYMGAISYQKIFASALTCRSRFPSRSGGSSGRRTSWSAFIRRCGASNGTSGCFRVSKAVRRSGICSREERQQNSERCFRVGCENSRKRSYTTDLNLSTSMALRFHTSLDCPRE